MRPRFAEPEAHAEAATVPSLGSVIVKMLAFAPLVAFSVWAGLEMIGRI